MTGASVLAIWGWMALLAGPQRVEMHFGQSFQGEKIGTETAVIEVDTAAGTKTVTSENETGYPARASKIKTTLRLKEPGGEVLGYTLEASVGGVEQKLETQRLEGKVRFRASSEPEGQGKDIDAPEPLVVLDNMVGSHLAALVERFPAPPEGGMKLQVAVPQAAIVIPATLSRRAGEKGRFNGKEVGVDVYDVQLGTIVETVRVSPEVPGHLLEVDVAIQGFRILRDGFERGGAAPAPAAETAPAAFVSEEMKVGSGELALGGTLTLPATRKGKVPGLVLVHGSGPNDRDETIAEVNKPFRDLAEGLAARGIAVLRYDKRTFAWKGKMPIEELVEKAATLEKEAVEDAVAAVKLLSERPEVEPNALFVLGHSLGGFALPYVLKKAEGAAGGIALAGSARPLDEVLLEQSRYLLPRQGLPPDAVKAQMADLEKMMARMRSGEASPDENMLGAPARYWRDLLKHDPAKDAAKLPQPLLFLFGEKDYQVTSGDADRWRQACAEAGKKNASFKTFPGLNHLFMKVDGESDGSDYQRPGKMAPEVIEEIASWLAAQIP